MHNTPEYVDTLQWHQTIGYARQICARVFRDGGAPCDALKAYGLVRSAEQAGGDWSKAVELIAEVMCSQSQKQAA